MPKNISRIILTLIIAGLILSFLPPVKILPADISIKPKIASAQVSTFLPFIGGIITGSRRCPCSFLGGRAVTIKTAPFEIPATVYISSMSRRWTRGGIFTTNPIIVYKWPFFIEHCRRFSFTGCKTIPTPDGFTRRHGPGTPGGQ